jgi:hypothetical protein
MPRSNTKKWSDTHKYKTWSNKEARKIKDKQEQDVCDCISEFKGGNCNSCHKADFQSAAVQTLHPRCVQTRFTVLMLRMREENLGRGAYIMVPVSRTTFYTVVYPALSNVHFWHAHYGDWAIPLFRTRLIGSLANTKAVQRAFGSAFICPRQQAGLSGYNSTLANGPLAGYLLFLCPDPQKGFQVSVCLAFFRHLHSSTIISTKFLNFPFRTLRIVGPLLMKGRNHFI